jgi:hypothetical protein
MAGRPLLIDTTNTMGSYGMGSPSTEVPPTPALKRLDMGKRLSLYQKSILVRERLSRVPGFQEAFLDPHAPYAAAADAAMPNDPVSIVCHCLRLGNSLSFLFNALRLRQLELDPEAKPPNIGACKKRVIHFLMALKSELGWVDEDLFQVTDVYKLDTTGTVKVRFHLRNGVVKALTARLRSWTACSGCWASWRTAAC